MRGHFAFRVILHSKQESASYMELKKMWRSFKSVSINGTIHMKYKQMLNQGSGNFRENDSLDVENMVMKTDS